MTLQTKDSPVLAESPGVNPGLLVILIGAHCAGKSTLAPDIARDQDAVVLSLDDLRAKLSRYGEGWDPAATAAALSTLHRQVEALLLARRRIVVDAPAVRRSGKVCSQSRWDASPAR